jgi:hypothetical protein
MHFRKVNVHRDETASMEIHVGDWEVAVLESKHPEGAVTVGELVEFEGREWPDNAGSEMQRLKRLYGMTGSGDDALSWAERVYGAGSAGVRSLDAAIKAARKEAEGAPKAKRGRPRAEKPDLVGAATG